MVLGFKKSLVGALVPPSHPLEGIKRGHLEVQMPPSWSLPCIENGVGDEGMMLMISESIDWWREVQSQYHLNHFNSQAWYGCWSQF